MSHKHHRNPLDEPNREHRYSVKEPQLMESIEFISHMVSMATQLQVMRPYEVLSVPMKIVGDQQHNPSLLLLWADDQYETQSYLVSPAVCSFQEGLCLN